MNSPGGFAKMFSCDQSGCDHKCRWPSHLKQHLAFVHDIGMEWHHCDQSGCDHKCKQASDLKRHLANVHDIGVIWHHCDQSGCDHKSKHMGDLKTHLADVHNIGVTLYTCDQSGCDKQFKQAGHLKTHLAFIHDIGVTWHHCDQSGCDQQFKKAGNLKTHLAFVHDIGKHTCEFCYCNRNSCNKFKDHTGQHSICNKCYKKVTGKGSRKETLWSDYLDKNLGTEGLLSSDVSLKSSGGCQKYRPDKLYTDTEYVEIGELDENEHGRTSGSYSCDEKRISDIYDEDGINGKVMVVLRLNPDSYGVQKGCKRVPIKERYEIYVALAKKLRNKCNSDKIHIYYMFYSKDNTKLSQNIPHTLIYSMEDIESI
jgi:hypothetical protein